MGSNWSELYKIAVFEVDEHSLSERIGRAERELIRRARELFLAPSKDLDEEQAIDRALYALHTLQDCVDQKYGKAA